MDRRRIAARERGVSSHPDADGPGARARDARLHYAPSEARVLGAIAVIATLAILWIMLPVGVGILLGAVLAFTAYPWHRSLAHRLGRPRLVAVLVTTLTTLLVTATIGALGYVLALKGAAVAAALPASLAPGGSGDRLVHQLDTALASFGIQPASLADRLRGAAGGIATAVGGRAAQLLAAVFETFLALFFMATTMFFVLCNWAELGRRAERLIPINPRHTRRLLREAQRLGRSVVIGNFGTAVAQGVIAGAGFALARAPEAVLLGAMTSVASLVPVVGTLIVWVPASLLLFATDHAPAAVFVLVWGALAIVGFCDYVVRPRLIGSGESMSGWMTLVALFGGLELFGVVGVLLGPMIVGLALAALRVYERTRRFRLDLH